MSLSPVQAATNSRSAPTASSLKMAHSHILVHKHVCNTQSVSVHAYPRGHLSEDIHVYEVKARERGYRWSQYKARGQCAKCTACTQNIALVHNMHTCNYDTLSDLQFSCTVKWSLSIAVEGCPICSITEQTHHALYTACSGCFMESTGLCVSTLESERKLG